MLVRTKFSPRILLPSVIGGVVLSALVMLIDFALSRMLTEKTTLIPNGDASLVSRTILLFLSMSFFLLLKVLFYAEDIWKRGLYQVDSEIGRAHV